jgi:glycosyltransferase involved in cell wall biosynthesis
MPGNSPSPSRVLLLEQGEGLWGPQQGLMRLAPLLEALGIEQILAGPRGPLARAWQLAGRRFEHVPAPQTRSIRGRSGRLSVLRATRELVRTVASAVRVARIARSNRVDVIVANNHWSHLEGVLAGRIARVPVVLQLHEHHKDDALGRLRRFAVIKAARTVAVSDSIRRALPAEAWERVEVIRNGIAAVTAPPESTLDRLRTELGTRGRRAVLALARYQREKGLDDLIEAVAILPDGYEDVRLLLAGGSREDDAYEAYLRRLTDERLPGRARFLGFRDDTPALLALADVCALPSHVEGLGIAVLEAQASGCPVVAANVGGVPEVVEHEVTGLLFTPGDVERLSAELARVLSDAELRERLRRNGLARVRMDGTLERQAESFAKVLRSVQ